MKFFNTTLLLVSKYMVAMLRSCLSAIVTSRQSKYNHIRKFPKVLFPRDKAYTDIIVSKYHNIYIGKVRFWQTVYLRLIAKKRINHLKRSTVWSEKILEGEKSTHFQAKTQEKSDTNLSAKFSNYVYLALLHNRQLAV